MSNLSRNRQTMTAVSTPHVVALKLKGVNSQAVVVRPHTDNKEVVDDCGFFPVFLD